MLTTRKNRSSSIDQSSDLNGCETAGNLPDTRPLVLIVEDEPDVAELIRYNLARDGYATLIAETGDSAVETTLQSMPDLILLDIMLPGMNGWEVCQSIRGSAKSKQIPIIMVSALTTEERRIKGLSLGADDYITKPFSVQELLIKTRNIVSKHALIRDITQWDEERESTTRYLLHEMRSAVSIIGGFSSLAERKSDNSTYLAHINSSAHHMESLLDDVALLANLEKGRTSLSREEVDITAIAASLADSFRETAGKRHISLIVESPSSLIAVVNATALRQILTNLISNAIKYSHDHGAVRIACKAVNGKAVLSVIDSGIGIRKEELTKIFNKFYRARGSEGISGTGLGLYIAGLLAEAMGGSITVTSVFGEGSTFSLVLGRPAAQKDDRKGETAGTGGARRCPERR